jgi:hypothetical protein
VKTSLIYALGDNECDNYTWGTKSFQAMLKYVNLEISLLDLLNLSAPENLKITIVEFCNKVAKLCKLKDVKRFSPFREIFFYF